MLPELEEVVEKMGVIDLQGCYTFTYYGNLIQVTIKLGRFVLNLPRYSHKLIVMLSGLEGVATKTGITISESKVLIH